MTEEQSPSEQRGGTTPDAAEAREKGEWAGRGGRGRRPRRARRLRRAARDARRGPGARQLGARPHDRLGRARHRGRIDLSAGDEADATTDGGSEPPEGVEPDTKDIGAADPPAQHRQRCLRAFAEAAARDGIVLGAAIVRLALRAGPRRARARGEGAPRPGDRGAGDGGARGARPIYARLKGDVSVLHAARANLLLRSTSCTRRPAP